MDNLPVYLLKVSIGTGLFYICFISFFKNDTFYLRNRILLISSLLIPFIIPVLKTPSYFGGEVITITNNTISELLQPSEGINSITPDKISSFNFNNICIYIYFSILLLILIKGILGVTKTYRLIRNGIILDSNFPKIVISDQQHSPFSFFPYIVIPRNIYNSGNYIQILEHESAHIRQAHTFDLLLNELVIAFQWFNPFVWLIKKSILLNHEFLADRFSLREAENIKEYQYNLLNASISASGIPFTHSFGNLIKTRVIMINKKPSSRYAILKNLVIIPTVIVLFAIFSFKGNTNLQETIKQTSVFSKESQTYLRVGLSTNTVYPSEALANNISGRFTVLVKTAKGGKVEKVKVASKNKKINVPYISDNCINIIRFDPPESTQTKIASNTKNVDLTLLTDEAVKIAKSLHYFNLPECQEKSLEFAIDFNFYTLPVIVLVNDKEVKYNGLDKIDKNSISRVSFEGSAYSVSKYGERGKNGVCEIYMLNGKLR